VSGTVTDTAAETQASAGRPAPGWMRILIFAGAVLAVLLLGASAGLLIQLPDREVTQPGPESVDVGFSQDMTVHHQQAALMAGLARGQAQDPRLRLLGYDIETSQLGQIGMMQGWLNLWDAALLPTDGHMAWMGATSTHDHGGGAAVAVMPGMATDEELTRLREASGREFDVLFLQLMTRHHQGGIPMMADAAERAQVPQVRNLAGKMLGTQDSEIEYMTELLAEFGAQPLPPPDRPGQ